eukprot:TRINITY_DN18711_c0_g1_i2.p2 TRINITY_DN18711_c0_g1~~TRINITY_DN18711_c0_g1_i2.p2  ORF type:complete len:236 (+),score=41.12 TRINITY_DN18711_c0_g1_i2:146-853(+)
MGDRAARQRTINDFQRWFHDNREEPTPMSIGESIPEGVSSLSARYGTFGARAHVDGGPIEKLSKGQKQLSCPDSERQPPAPCVATGECGDLLELARRFELSMEQAKIAAKAAQDALRYSDMMQNRVKEALSDNLSFPTVSHLSADGENMDIPRMIRHILWGPGGSIPDTYPDMQGHNADLLDRMQDEWNFEKRAAIYLEIGHQNGAEHQDVPRTGSRTRIPSYSPSATSTTATSA